jgi:hypothetical protein
VRNPILDDGVDGIEHEPERVTPLPRHEPRSISSGSRIGRVRHAAFFLHTAHRDHGDARGISDASGVARTRSARASIGVRRS